MELMLSADLKARLDRCCCDTERSPNEVIVDALTGYFEGLDAVRATLDRRYDEAVTGRVRMIPGDEVVAHLKARSAAFRAGYKEPSESAGTSDTEM